MAHRLLPLYLAALLAPAWASAQGSARRTWIPGESGFVVGADLGGGSAFGTGSQYTPNGRFELEVSAGYEFPYGIRPEVAFALGMAPNGHVAIRPGLHVPIPDLPLYGRAAVDWTTLTGVGSWRWLMLGGGGEIRITGLVSGFLELDLGIPVVHDAGIETLARAGISVRL